jgi:hypothetical protein
VEHSGSFVPVLCGFLLVSSNFHLWKLDEEKRFLVIALPSWDPKRRRSFFCGSELQINLLVSCLLEFIPLSNPRSYFSIDLHICVVASKIFGCRCYLHQICKVSFIYFLQIQVFHSLLHFTFARWLIRHKCQGDPDPRVIRSVVLGLSVPDLLLSFCMILK